MALMMPWLAFLFVGVLDFGFYSYAAICTQNAARAAALRAAVEQGTGNACNAALGEMKGLPNTIGLATCAANAGAITPAIPVAVSAVLLNGTSCADCNCGGIGTCTFAATTSYQASVTYQSMPMIPIPGVLTGQMTLTRRAEMRTIQ
jgi:Flp pilus assembly protein TadG